MRSSHIRFTQRVKTDFTKTHTPRRTVVNPFVSRDGGRSGLEYFCPKKLNDFLNLCLHFPYTFSFQEGGMVDTLSRKDEKEEKGINGDLSRPPSSLASSFGCWSFEPQCERPQKSFALLRCRTSDWNLSWCCRCLRRSQWPVKHRPNAKQTFSPQSALLSRCCLVRYWSPSWQFRPEIVSPPFVPCSHTHCSHWSWASVASSSNLRTV